MNKRLAQLLMVIGVLSVSFSGCNGDSDSRSLGVGGKVDTSGVDDEFHCGTDDSGQVKVKVCHVPPGNPSAAHAIMIGLPAVAAHLGHHDDYLLTCDEAPAVDEACDPNGNDDDSGNNDDDDDDGSGGEEDL